MTKTRFLFAAIALFIAATGEAAAATTLTFTSSLVYAQAGQIADFEGTVTNTGPSTVFLNGDTVTSALPFDDTPFLTAPLSLGAGETWTGILFRVLTGPSVVPGLYSGTFNLLGGDDSSASDLLASAPFAVQVVPEPATLSGTAGALGFVILAWKRRR